MYSSHKLDKKKQEGNEQSYQWLKFGNDKGKKKSKNGSTITSY
jgi:hypothetical protein